eukprot:gnl/Spiro4/6444_TR3306_c0_g1_i1.p1 gnl/Spiro4/6444_TR3306_c0_g1~~gnl/Spiro4/6444_TR3306_c0_g1_i1.p1  ORF type:complete len:176 (+),score=41.63 gnl/Spiro4/6444_TR3306_c0_g1_i1:52-579(+)
MLSFYTPLLFLALVVAASSAPRDNPNCRGTSNTNYRCSNVGRQMKYILWEYTSWGAEETHSRDLQLSAAQLLLNVCDTGDVGVCGAVDGLKTLMEGVIQSNADALLYRKRLQRGDGTGNPYKYDIVVNGACKALGTIVTTISLCNDLKGNKMTDEQEDMIVYRRKKKNKRDVHIE